MEEQIIEQTVVEEIPIAPVESVYEYQPTDESGRPIGGRQVIKYTTVDELTSKLQEQNILLIRKLREQTRKNRLGIVENEEMGDAPTFGGFTEFAPKEFTDDERYELARKLQDPVTAFEAVNSIVEASVGAPLNQVGKKMNNLEQENLGLRAKVEANAFVADNSDYYKCNENFEAITSWMVRYNLVPVKANYQKAYDTLKAQGLLILGPAAQQAPIVEHTPAPVTEPVIEPVVEQPVYTRVPTGLNRDTSSASGPVVSVGDDIVYTLPNGVKLTGLKAVAAMPGEEYGHRLKTDKEFGKKVEKLEKEARKPRV